MPKGLLPAVFVSQQANLDSVHVESGSGYRAALSAPGRHANTITEVIDGAIVGREARDHEMQIGQLAASPAILAGSKTAISARCEWPTIQATTSICTRLLRYRLLTREGLGRPARRDRE